MLPDFASDIIKDNSHYLTKVNSHLLLALDSKILKSSSSLLGKLKFVGQNYLQVVNKCISN